MKLPKGRGCVLKKQPVSEIIIRAPKEVAKMEDKDKNLRKRPIKHKSTFIRCTHLTFKS